MYPILNGSCTVKKAEKFIKPDAQDRWLDFEGFDMLPQEAEAAEEAEKELKATREAIIARKKAGKQHPARKSLPENLEREEVTYISRRV